MKWITTIDEGLIDSIYITILYKGIKLYYIYIIYI